LVALLAATTGALVAVAGVAGASTPVYLEWPAG
jgi:hypothetical protein